MKVKTMQVTALIMLVLSLAIVQSFAQTEEWRATYDFSIGASPNLYPAKDVGSNIGFDSAGNIYVLVTTIAWLDRTLDSPTEWIIFKYDSDGNKLWHYEVGHGNWASSPSSFYIDSQGNVYGAYTSYYYYYYSSDNYGGGKHDANIFKLNSNGTLVWSKSWNNETTNSEDWAIDLDVDPSGNIYFVIKSDFSTNILYSNYKPIIQKYNTNGNLLWEVTGELGSPNAIDTDSNGDLFVLFGGSVRKYSSSAGALLSSGAIEYWWDDNGLETNPTYWKAAPCIDLKVASDDNFYVIANVEQKFWYRYGPDEPWQNEYHDNFFTAKLDNDCNVLWRDEYGTYEDDEYPTDLVIDSEGNILVTGPEAYNMVTLKYSPSGTRLGTYKYSNQYDLSLFYIENEYIYTIENSPSSGTTLYQYLLSTSAEQWNLPLTDIKIKSYLCGDSKGNLYLTGSVHDGETHSGVSSSYADDMLLIKFNATYVPPPDPDPVPGAPENLTTLAGYHQAVPLAWKPPSSGAENVTGYNIYRQSEGGSESKVTGPINQTYYRDTNLTNGVPYTYRVTAVNSSGEGNYSTAKNGKPREKGYQAEAAWTNQAPTIDGYISTGEWDNSESYQITYPGKDSLVTMMVMYDDNYLYLAIDDPTDNSLNNYDGVSLFFDENWNREWPSSSDGKEGMIRISYNNGQVISTYSSFHGQWPNADGDTWITASGINGGISATAGNVQYEVRFHLTNSPINPGNSEGIGWSLYLWEGGTSGFNAYWPQAIVNKLKGTWPDYSWAHGPFSYGDLLFGEEEEEEEPTDNTIIRMDPATKSIKLSQSDTVNAVIENVTELSGFEFTIDYDPAVVQVSDASDIILGNFLGSTSRSVIPLTPTINNTTGQMTYTVASFGSQTCPSGQGILAIIIWTAVGTGTSQLDLSSVQITDPMGDPMTVTLVDGEIVVTDTHFADLDSDGDVDIVDIQKVAAHYGSKEGDLNWDSKYDIDGDGDVDIVDIQKVAAWYGEDISEGATPKVNIKPDTRQNPIRLQSVMDPDAHAVDLYIEEGALLGGFELSVSSKQKLPEIESIQLGELFEGMQDNILLLDPFTSKNKLNMTLGLCSFNRSKVKPDVGHALRIIFKDNPEPLSITGIQCVDVYGKVMSSEAEMVDVSSDIEAIPDKYILYQNYPNPFNPFTEIPFEVMEQGQASLIIYNLKGEQIRTIFKRIISPGKHTYVWDGKNDYGEKVGNGIYMYVLQIGSMKQTKKMIYMK